MTMGPGSGLICLLAVGLFPTESRLAAEAASRAPGSQTAQGSPGATIRNP